MKLILASASPRRFEILKNIVSDFEVLPSDVEEQEPNINKDDDNYAINLCMALALKKAQSVFEKYGNVVLGADTLVFLNQTILGKPQSEKQAFNTLKQLSGKTHTVITGIALVSDQKTITDYDQSFVTFPNLSDQQIIDYIQNYRPYDKAGAYGLQEIINIWDVKYTGSYTNILGLPEDKVNQMLSLMEGILCQR